LRLDRTQLAAISQRVPAAAHFFSCSDWFSSQPDLMKFLPRAALLLVLTATHCVAAEATNASAGVRKVSDIIIYESNRFYSAFPSIIRRPDGELITAFRRAPERRAFGEPGSNHTDPNSYLVQVRSSDNGRTWSTEPQLIWAHPQGGSQDPCMLQLRDGSILCSSYAWAFLTAEAAAKVSTAHRHGNVVFLGGYLVRSTDGARTWTGPIIPPSTPGEISKNPFGEPIPAYNRGALCEGKDGRIYWVTAANTSLKPRNTETHLFISADKGLTWEYSCPVAADDKVTFNETSLYQTPKGDFVAFLRTANFNDHTCIARSADNGRSFQPWEDTGWKGHPHYALQLPDKRVLLVYGYRHQPFGIRARVLNAECTDAATAPEIVLRDDGGNGDLGYPWATMISKREALVVYYFNKANGTRHIAGTIVEID
jgi:sialidase-1